MSIKIDIQTQINTITDGGNNPSSTVRNALGTAAASLLENIYMTPITDENGVSEVITTSNSNFSYTVKFTKVGRLINISGSFKNISGGALTFTPIFEITNTEYDNDELVKSVARITTVGNSDTIAISLNATNELQSKDTILNNESFSFNFNYNALN